MNKLPELLYCIEHEETVEAAKASYGNVEFIHAIIELPDNIDWCEFPLGYAFCPPPPFNLDEWIKENGQPPAVVDEDFLPYSYDVNTDRIVEEVLVF